ncbi:MAG TPA: tRNA (adenosine(37)-N6)-dimethylallyltransferase MiaA [Planctomycetota bacterium]|nr:tRNA (adenosine(37)-N6)-dimethylallyltransferase MiaA [Planctomycetota bacterium]
MTSSPIPVLIGPTGIGKSEVALLLAEQLHADLLLIDAYKVYRELNIGVTKPSPSDRQRVPHFGLDILSVFESGNVEKITTIAAQVIAEPRQSGKPLIVEGNAPLYLKILFEGMFEGPAEDPVLRAALTAEAQEIGVPALHQRLAAVDPAAARKIETNDIRRIIRALEVHTLTGQPISLLQEQWGKLRDPHAFAVVGLRTDKEYLWERMRSRVSGMLDAGWLDECRQLLALETPDRKLARTASQAEGYHQLFDLIRNGETLEGATRARIEEAIFIGHRQNARRAMQWYRKWPYVQWVDRTPDSTVAGLARQVGNLWRAAGVPC